jgi:hypothetical protein
MTVDRAVLAFMGALVVFSLAFSLVFGPWWLAFTAGVGLNMVQAAFTGVCPVAALFKKMGLKPGLAFG